MKDPFELSAEEPWRLLEEPKRPHPAAEALLQRLISSNLK